MSHEARVHIISACLIVFILGDIVFIPFLSRMLWLARRRLTIPLILLIGLALTHAWVIWYYVSILLSYYARVRFGPYYSVILAGAVAPIPWVVLVLWLIWARRHDGESSGAP